MSTYFVDGSFYSKKRGYGIVNQADVAGNTKAEQSLNNGGWNHRESDGEGYKTAYEMWENGTAVIGDRQVLVFRCDVKDFGTYKINLEFIADNDITGMKIWSGRRNLVRDSFDLKKGQKYETSFYVNVTPYIPALSSVPMMDKTIFISVSGMHAQLGKIEILKEDVPVIWIAGDSTLTDQNAGFPYYPYGSCTGWAQILECFAINVAVSNHAHSGLT
ncbi:MAG: hypothetical protein K6B41_12090, partial [Butyrivibrio sp.]|nr:hypothetical protein [Butyrivibrio sp.]